MVAIHTNLKDRWNDFPLSFQMMNIGAEFARVQKWKNTDKKDLELQAKDRLLELIDFTISDPKHSKRLNELLRLREIVLDDYFSTNLSNYFINFRQSIR